MKKILLLLVAMLATTTVWATEFITDVMVIGGSKSETNDLKDTYTTQGWTVIDQDLNAGCGSGSDYVYLLYKKASNDSIDAGAFITDFYLMISSQSYVPNNFDKNGLTYYLVPYDGGNHFKSVLGDLNSNAGGKYIHLFYAKDDNKNYRSTAVTSIEFNATSAGAVCADVTTTACDLNSGAGGDYIYMHANSADKGWIPYMNNNNTQCYIDGFAGPKETIKEVTVPLTIDGAEVLYFSDRYFSQFTNIETINFHENSVIDWMPSMQNCSKFKHVNTILNNGYTCINITPSSMTSIPSYGFAGTAIDSINLPYIDEIGDNAFDGCNLSSVLMDPSYVQIGDYAFANISSNCKVSYNGSINDWSPSMYMYSPNLIIEGTSWSCGWCGGANDNSYNSLYWTLNNANLTISSYSDLWEYYPLHHVITTRNWVGRSINNITLEHVFSIGQREFENLNALENVYIDPTLHSIGKEAFYGCNNLKDIWFDGNQQQWNAVTKDANWKDGTSNLVEHWHCIVTFNANGHGTTPDPKTIQWTNLDKVDEPEPLVADGYNFLGWFTDAACTNQWDFDNVIPGDMTLYAGWQEIVVNVPGDVDGDGSVTSADVTALYSFLLNGDASNIVNGDQDGDGNITAGDVTTVYSILLGN